jgi:hypothetical protein
MQSLHPRVAISRVPTLVAFFGRGWELPNEWFVIDFFVGLIVFRLGHLDPVGLGTLLACNSVQWCAARVVKLAFLAM